MEPNKNKRNYEILTFGLFNYSQKEVRLEETQLQIEDQNGVKRRNDSVTRRVLGGVACVLVFSLVGCFSGYQIYIQTHHNNNKPVSKPNESNSGYDVQQIQQSLEKGTLLEDYSLKTYQLLNYAFDNFAKTKYNIIIGQGNAVAKTGPIQIDQKIQAATYNTPNGFFNQKTSSSSLVNTADRYYENVSLKSVEAYEYAKPEDWKNSSSNHIYSYDDYIQTFGKLGKGIYYCVDSLPEENRPIPEKFLTDNEAVYNQSNEKTKHKVNGSLIYNLDENTVLKYSDANRFNTTKYGYEIQIEMDVQNNYGIGFSQVQMKSTGGLSSLPTYLKSILTFRLDNQLNLISSHFHDEYKALKSVIMADISCDLDQYYFTSNNARFVNGNGFVDVNIPKIDEMYFKGFDLLSGIDVEVKR
jgi:hypothetical protein